MLKKNSEDTRDSCQELLNFCNWRADTCMDHQCLWLQSMALINQFNQTNKMKRVSTDKLLKKLNNLSYIHYTDINNVTQIKDD